MSIYKYKYIYTHMYLHEIYVFILYIRVCSAEGAIAATEAIFMYVLNIDYAYR